MRKKAKESKMNVVLTSLFVVFACLLSFSVGVISGKGWSDREYKVKFIEKDAHLKSAMEDNEPIGDEMTEKEVELLTQRALEEAQAQQPQPLQEEKKNETAEPSKSVVAEDADDEEADTANEQTKVDAAKSNESAKVATKAEERKISSLMPKPSTPKPTSIEYTVQVAAYKTLKEAEIHSQKLIDKGFPAFPVQTNVDGKLWYRVSIGSFKNRAQALKYNEALTKQAVVKDAFVQKIKRVK